MPSPSAAISSSFAGVRVFSFLSFTSFHLTELQTDSGLPSLSVNGWTALTQTAPARAAPTRLPMSAWLELLGMPNHQVSRFQQMAATSPQMRTSWVTNRASTSPEEMVLATASPKKAPNRFVHAASMMAWRGVSTLVPITVAMALAVSWNPLV